MDLLKTAEENDARSSDSSSDSESEMLKNILKTQVVAQQLLGIAGEVLSIIKQRRERKSKSRSKHGAPRPKRQRTSCQVVQIQQHAGTCSALSESEFSDVDILHVDSERSEITSKDGYISQDSTDTVELQLSESSSSSNNRDSEDDVTNEKTRISNSTKSTSCRVSESSGFKDDSESSKVDVVGGAATRLSASSSSSSDSDSSSSSSSCSCSDTSDSENDSESSQVDVVGGAATGLSASSSSSSDSDSSSSSSSSSSSDTSDSENVTPAPPRPPVVASHNLPQQPSRPSATATAAPVKKNVINSQPKPPDSESSQVDVVGGAATGLSASSSSSSDSDSSSSSSSSSSSDTSDSENVTPAPPRPPVVASHNLPQQPSRPSATATAAPVKKNVINSQPKPPGHAPVTTASVTTPVVQAPVPSQTQPVPSEPELRARTPQIPTPPLDPAPPTLLSKPRERNTEPDHSTSNSYSANKAPELTAQPGLPNYTVRNQAPAITSSVTNGEKKMEQKPSPVSSTPTAKKQAEFKLKNYGSWFSLAQSAANSPITSNTSTHLKSRAMDSFQQFKKQAKEKMDKQRQLYEQQELRRRQKEQAEKERLRMEREKQREREEVEALERARKTQQQQQQQQKDTLSNRREDTPMTPVIQPKPESPAPVPSPALSEREELRRREQEKRRRQARASHIDMNRQSDIMAAFEENFMF